MSGALLITRPQPQADEFAASLEGENIEVFIEPLLQVVEEDFVAPSLARYDILIFTSASGVRIWRENAAPDAVQDAAQDFEGVVFAPGAQTAAALHQAGFANVESFEGAQDVIAALRKRLGEGTALHIRGSHQAHDIAGTLEAEGLAIETLITYEMQKIDAFSAALIDKFHAGEIETITFFSRRSAETFAHLIMQHGLEHALEGIKALCISQAVLECLRKFSWLGSFAAKTPDRQGMQGLIREYM